MKFLKNTELQRPSPAAYESVAKLPCTVVLDNIRSGLNVGSIFRSADAFLVQKIVVCGITASPPDPEVLKTALGATQSVPWEHAPSTSDVLRKYRDSGHTVLGIEQSDTRIALHEWQPESAKNYVLVFGNELHGVDPSLAHLLDGCIEIPMSGTKHSLNVAVCAGIVLWKFYETLHLSLPRE